MFNVQEIDPEGAAALQQVSMLALLQQLSTDEVIELTTGLSKVVTEEKLSLDLPPVTLVAVHLFEQAVSRGDYDVADQVWHSVLLPVISPMLESRV